jgi:hypothetical protein
LKALSKECQLVTQCWIGLQGGEEIWGYILVNATTQVGFKYLGDSVDPQGLKCCNVSGVEWKELVCSGVPPNGGVVQVLLANKPHSIVRDSAEFKNKLMGVMVYF